MAFKKKTDFGNTEGFKFEKPKQSLEGYYMGSTVIQIDGSDVKKHIFSTSKGLVSVLGQAHLGQLLEGLNPGTMVRATYVSSRKLKKGTMKLYELEYDEDDVIETDGIQLAEPEASEPEEEAAEEEYQEEAVEEEAEEEQAPPPPVKRAAPPTQRPAPGKTTAVSPDQKARAQALLSGKKQ